MEPQEFANFLSKYPQSLNGFAQLKALLNDCYPQEREETLPLIFAFDLGIVEKINDSELDETFVCNMVQALKENYGLDQYRSERATLLWSYAYGVEILKKSCSVDASGYFENLQSSDKKTENNESNPSYSIEQAVSDYELGMKHYRSEEYSDAVKLYQTSASSGYAAAQFALGSCYEKGKGVSRNPKEAVKWYKKAAEQDYVLAESSLASAYFTGGGIHRNYDNALYWAQKAADQGDDNAMVILGKIYEEGLTGDRNFSEAYRWYRQAAEHGHVEAMYKVANFLVMGRAVERNPSEAAYWNRKAADSGFANAQYSLGLQYLHGDGIDQDPVEALVWIRRAATNGHAQAINDVIKINQMLTKKGE